MIPFGVCYNEGLYHYFAAESGVFSSSVLHFTSENLIDWQETAPVYANKPGKTGPGSALIKNGKLYLMYDRGMFSYKQYLSLSRNGEDFEEHPVPVITRKSCKGRGISRIHSPKIFYSNGAYYALTACKTKRGGGAALFISKNLIDWDFFRIVFTSPGTVIDCPSLVSTAGGNYLLYSKTDKKKKENSTLLAHCSVDLSNGYFEIKEGAETLQYFSYPRASRLPDGRIILTLNGSLKEIKWDTKMEISPLSELILKRGAMTENTTAAEGGCELHVPQGDNETELSILSHQGTVTAAFGRNPRASVVADGEKNTLTISAEEETCTFPLRLYDGKLRIRAVQTGYLFDLYVGGIAAFSKVLQKLPDGNIGIKTEGAAAVSVTAYGREGEES